MWALESEILKERSEHLQFREPHCHSASPRFRDPCANIRTNLMFLETRVIGLHLTLVVYVYLHSNFSGGLRKTFFPQDCVLAVQGRPRSLILVKIESAYATSYKSDIVTLVLFCTFSEILQVFALMTPPLFHPNVGVFPLVQIGHVGVSISLKLISSEIIFEVFQLTSSRYLNVTDGRTDRQTDRRHPVA